MAQRIPIVDTLVPMTPAGAIADLSEVPAHLQTPSIRYPLTVEQMLERMDGFGIGQAIIPARRYGPQWGLSYEGLRDFVARTAATVRHSRHRSRWIACRECAASRRRFATSASSGRTPTRRGQVSRPTIALYYPYYAKAEELGVPFQVECMAAKQAMSMGHPKYLDRVATDFPDVKLVATHTGYPWERELVAYAEFRPNFYIGMDTLPTQLWGLTCCASSAATRTRRFIRRPASAAQPVSAPRIPTRPTGPSSGRTTSAPISS